MTSPSTTLPDQVLQHVHVQFARYGQIQCLAREVQREGQPFEKVASLLASLNHLMQVATQAHDEVMQGLANPRHISDSDRNTANSFLARYEQLMRETQTMLFSIEQGLQFRQAGLIPEVDRLLIHGKAARAYQQH